jgi:hypothetical protein
MGSQVGMLRNTWQLFMVNRLTMLPGVAERDRAGALPRRLLDVGRVRAPPARLPRLLEGPSPAASCGSLYRFTP